jgi:purine-binding chemotaxis protein CheW
MSDLTPSNTANTGTQAGKYLTLRLGHESYGISILRVQEIIKPTEITPVPRVPDYLKGVINLRGSIIPIINLRLKMRMPEKAFTSETCIIIVQVHGISEELITMGIVVDQVADVIELPQDRIEGPPHTEEDARKNLAGIGKLNGRVILLLNIDEAISPRDIIAYVESRA